MFVAEPALQIAFVLAVLTKADAGQLYEVRPLLSELLRRRLTPNEREALTLLRRLTADWTTWTRTLPLPGLLRLIERHVAEHGISDPIRSELDRLRSIGRAHATTAEAKRAMAAIDSILGAEVFDERYVDDGDLWGAAVRQVLRALTADERQRWLSVFGQASTLPGQTPSAAWLRRASERIETVGRAAFTEGVLQWLDLVDSSRNARPEPHRAAPQTSVESIGDHNAGILKGLVWFCTALSDDRVAPALGDTAIACFKKIPDVGARSTKAGNACIYALGALGTPAAVAQLHRLLQRVKYPSAQTLVGRALDEAAQRAGLTAEELAELSVPAYDLDNGVRRWELGGFVAELVIDGSVDVELRWQRADRSPLRSEPAAVKREHPAGLKELKRLTGELRKLLPAQRDRIERLLLAERSWPLADWRERYLDHPLLFAMARRLIWHFESADRVALGGWLDGRVVGVDDRPLDWIDAAATRIRLWHPIEADPATVLAWREWLERHEVVQPFKQAHREVYLLTDAEHETETYSNRFAAHVLRQHQFQALCQARGWRYRLQGGFDGHNTPTLSLPGWDLLAEYWVEGALDAGLTEAGICLYVTTDQVRFTRSNGQAIPLVDVPPLVFSEVMRDVDLFVGVGSIGADPIWLDTGPAGLHGYWASFAFGDLSASARTRHAILERLVPRLKIAARSSLEGKYLVVRGDLRTYKIHLGSGNVLMEPGSQYLCVVPGRNGDKQAPHGRVFLPFEGDPTLSVILSKALLLADDRAIKDPTITRQIRRG
ncbi:MAG: DUF4132 domain-containing protein [Chloroflexi bacterium]|nr:DUF4132 domain-containing protein [Chloroflexota bacterium]